MPAGRPRGFDKTQALDRALELFWRNGFEGASVADLTEAMGVARPSLYAAFGDKDDLFRAVVARYLAGHGSYVQRALECCRAADAIRTLLLDAAAAVTTPDRPPGCLVVHGALACGEEGAVARDLLAAERLNRQAAIRARLERAAGEGDLPDGMDVVLLTEWVMATLHGLAVQALGGASREALTAVAEHAVRMLGLDESRAVAPAKRGRAIERAPGRRAKRGEQTGQLAMDL